MHTAERLTYLSQTKIAEAGVSWSIEFNGVTEDLVRVKS
jgi:hypothetical protein